MPSRVLSEAEFNAIKSKLLADAPTGLDEAGFTRWFQPRFNGAIAEAEQLPAAPEGSAVGRFASNMGAMLNPLAAAQGVYQAVRHPIDTASALVQNQVGQGRQAIDLASQGRYTEALGHGAAAALPLVGPAAAQAGEQIASGDIAGGLGTGAGLLAPTLVPEAVRQARKLLPSGVRGRMADALESGAATRYTDVMAPTVGSNKTRFGGMAERVAPALAKDSDMGAWTREGLHAKVGEALASAEAELDSVSQASNANKVWHTKPILRDLQSKINELTAQTVRQGPVKAGENVVPAPRMPRVAALQQVKDEVAQLGPIANYEALRRIRQAWDGPAKAVYNPSMTADFLAKNGEKLGAADATGVLREHLARFEPATAAANAKYSLYKTANDVLDATAEVERTRPRVGRRLITRATTTVAGSQAGIPGAVVGFALGPVVDAAMSAGVTTQLRSAQIMSRMARAIRAGNPQAVQSWAGQLKSLVAKEAPQAAAITGGATSPSGFPGPTTDPLMQSP